MSRTRDKFEAGYDKGKGETYTERDIPESHEVAVVFRLIDVGCALGKVVKDKAKVLKGTYSALGRAASFELEASKAEAKRLQKDEMILDVTVILKGLKAGVAPEDIVLSESPLALAEARVERAQRFLTASQAAHLAAQKDFNQELRRDGIVAGKLERWWAQFSGDQARRDSQTWGEIRQREAVAQGVLDDIESLYVLAVPAMTSEERKRLRRAFKPTDANGNHLPRPTTMPTLEEVKKAMVSDAQNTPHAKARSQAALLKEQQQSHDKRMRRFYQGDGQRQAAEQSEAADTEGQGSKVKSAAE